VNLRPRVQQLKVPRARAKTRQKKNRQSIFYLKDLAKIFLLIRFEKILNTQSSLKIDGKWFSLSLFDTIFSQNQKQNCKILLISSTIYSVLSYICVK